MPQYRVKQATINAVQHPGPNKLVVVGRKGEQTANTGDFIVFYGDRPEDREVICNKEFFERYEADTEAGDAPETEVHVDQSEPVAGVDKVTPEGYENAVESAQETANNGVEPATEKTQNDVEVGNGEPAPVE